MDGLPHAFDQKPDAPTYLYVRGDERQPVKDEPLTPGVPEALGGRLEVRPMPVPLLARQPEKQPHVVAAFRAEAVQRVEQNRKALESCKTPDETTLAQLKLTQSETALSALEAVLAVEALEDLGAKDSPEWKEAAAETVRRQRRLALADAQLKQLTATRAAAAAKPAEQAKAQETVKSAADALAKAEADLAAPVGTDYKPRITETFPDTSTGRRLALARWITARENPLAARMAVNQMWLRHFGQGLVPSVADFGRNGTGPTHPALLDWLAASLMTGGYPGGRAFGASAPQATPVGAAQPWSMKSLHRLMVTSNTYRMASTPDPASLAKDPDNRYLWRMDYRRMDAEVVRDNVLYVTGQLDLQQGGPDINEEAGLSVKRRTIYFRHAAEKQMVFAGLFDGPNVTECYIRKQTVIPQQALALANSELALEQSRLLARQLNTTTGADARAFVAAAYVRVLAREVSPAELQECLQFLTAQAKLLSRLPAAADPAGKASVPASDPALRARENLVLVLINHNDFVTIR
jgi:hypothetical protein